ncbi:MAG: transporter substrate-binding domain-containing protein [Bauldia sp.]|nr:transporter substrate-binding domain-containing protein [Bauldia sp.]
MKIRRGIGLSFALAALVIDAAFAQGGIRLAPQDFLQPGLRSGPVRFCINTASILADFDRAVADLIAETMLVESTLHDIVDPYLRPSPYDYRIIRSSPDFYVDVINDCDAVMGYPLPDGTVPNWLTVSRPYYTSSVVLVATDESFRRLGDIPHDRPIGGRIRDDTLFRAYLTTLPQGRSWRLVPYLHNNLLLEAVIEGSVAAAVVWEPASAFYLALEGQSAPPMHVVEVPVDLKTVELAVAFRAGDAFLRSAIDAAIDELAADGLLRQLAAEFALPAPP